jgi:hypothetical protein
VSNKVRPRGYSGFCVRRFVKLSLAKKYVELSDGKATGRMPTDRCLWQRVSTRSPTPQNYAKHPVILQIPASFENTPFLRNSDREAKRASPARTMSPVGSGPRQSRVVGAGAECLAGGDIRAGAGMSDG